MHATVNSMEPDSLNASPVSPSSEATRRRVPVSSLLNCTNFDDMRKPMRGRSDSTVDMSDAETDDNDTFDATSPESNGLDQSTDDSFDAHHAREQSRRLGPTDAKHRKKQWTQKQVDELLYLYKQELRWEDIAERLGRSAVACKLKHNKELRRKPGPYLVHVPVREPLHSPIRPHHLVGEALSALATLKQHLVEDGDIMTRRIQDFVTEGFSSFARQDSHGKWTGSTPDRRPSADEAVLLDRLHQQLSWEISSVRNHEQKLVADAWAALARFQESNAPPLMQPLPPPGPPPGYAYKFGPR